MIKAINILQGHKVNTKKQRMQMKTQKQQSTAHNSKNDTWTIAEYDKSHQNIAGTQGNYEKTRNAEENAKATKYCAQQQKWYMNYCRIGKKSWKHCGHAEWYDFSPSDTT